MRVMLQLLVPGVEDTEEADFSAEMAGITRDFKQGLGAGAEQEGSLRPAVPRQRPNPA
jgi:hypothetical protein